MNEKEIDATVAALKKAASGTKQAFWYCKEGDDKKPMLLVNKDASAFEELVKAATQAKRVKSQDRVSGDVCKDDSGNLSFKLENLSNQKTMNSGLKELIKSSDLKSVKNLLDKAGTAVEGSEDGDETVSKLTALTAKAWEDATKVSLKPRSKALGEVDSAMAEYEKLAGKGHTNEVVALVNVHKKNNAWMADKAGESIRKEGGESLRKLLVKRAEKLVKELTVHFSELFNATPEQTWNKEQRRLEGPKLPLAMLANEFPEAKGAKTAEAAIAKKIKERVDGMQFGQIKAKKEGEVGALKVILAKPTQKLLLRKKQGEQVSDKEIVNAMFEDFFNYGKKTFTYNTTSDNSVDLLGAGNKSCACGSFAMTFGNLVNLVIGSKIASPSEISTKNFYTQPLKSLGFIDTKCPGNMILEGDDQPSCYFFTRHWITDIKGVGRFDPTTGRKDSQIDSAVVDSGFKSTNSGYEKSNLVIQVEKGKGYGGGSLYRLTSTK